jgi:nicotinate-nucleotide adenylyltransferase
LLPAGLPPHKSVRSDPGPDHRFEMCRLACESEDWLSASRLELDRDGPSYTVDTLRAIHAQAPGDELTFIVGCDMAATLPEWREPEAILELASLAVVERDGIAQEVLVDRLAGVLGDKAVAFLDIPRVDVSSTKVRQRVGEGRPIRHIVPDAVARYVAEHKLYDGATG